MASIGFPRLIEARSRPVGVKEERIEALTVMSDVEEIR
ncbi:hypothetical protein PAMC26577_35245 [Caballeronia sordidicola]|uniref:Uncharacterized protein n=1 Tax=Caballeronia sordidicola TaxID=196367 RepID=A0A242M9G0_CABSO|nr:hypothetical protein PAMC26577_35245 [Caballeronia sordidicola]